MPSCVKQVVQKSSDPVATAFRINARTERRSTQYSRLRKGKRLPIRQECKRPFCLCSLHCPIDFGVDWGGETQQIDGSHIDNTTPGIYDRSDQTGDLKSLQKSSISALSAKAANYTMKILFQAPSDILAGLTRYAASAVLFALLLAVPTAADEGMYPVSEIAVLGLMEKGLEISPLDIFNPDPDQTCLIDAICRVNGCTGSFVSPDGLIFTNHHCAFAAIQRASTAENDLLTNGFIAATRTHEVPALGYEVRITESYRDVSAEVLTAVTEEMDFAERTRAIERRQKEIEKQSETDNPGVRAEVAEMFAGKTYVLFHYTFIKDVRLVFAPPSSVGNFGGDVDNWEWPRHTGDFSFMRAYVAADGTTATFSADNVPYQPKRHVQVAAEGVRENDFVFLLGYPGRTARHKTAAFLEYERDVRLPYIVETYQWQMSVMEEAGAGDRSVALKHSSRIKGLANTEKRSRGQLKGLHRTDIVQSRIEVERDLQSFIESDPDRQQKYGDVLQEITDVYDEMQGVADFEMNFAGLMSTSRAMGTAMAIVDAVHERQKVDIERESPYMDRNFDQTSQRLLLGINDWHAPTDQILFDGMRTRLAGTAQAKQLDALQLLFEESNRFDAAAFASTGLGDPEQVTQWLAMNPEQIAALDDPFIQLTLALYPEQLRMREQDKQREGRLNQLYGSLVEVKQQFLREQFVPDANSTLRMTFGRIESYSPEDAVIKTPFTMLSGVIAKTTGEDPFVTPAVIQEMYSAGEFGSFVHPDLGQVPVNILYSTDTTGGNSGSPILNAHGELVGINFDRTFEATINDFAWNHNYSRSIGVDIRYALWITGKVYGANHLLDEMGIGK